MANPWENPNKTATEAKKEAEPKRLFGHCFEIGQIKENNSIPIGGENMFDNETNIEVEADFEHMEDFFREADESAEKNKRNADLYRKKLNDAAAEINVNTFLKLLGFNNAYYKRYSHNPEAEMLRKKYVKGNDLKISGIFNLNAAQCAEIAALAQVYLQRSGISSSYFSGEVVWDKNEEFPEPHSFIVIREKEKVYIYDPANPINATGGKLPSLFTTQANFDAEMSKGMKRFVEGKNVVTMKEAYYGVGNFTDFKPEKDVAK